ncbi:MAG: NAD(P)/FAD-dependent oxidoreductase [Roseobacter sp.]
MDFPISENIPATFTAPLPRAADVVVIGGGVVGVSTALFLARAGQRVVLLEKGRIAGEQSSRNWGWIRQQGRDLDELPIMVEANRLWRELAGQTNLDIGLTQGGTTYLARTEQKLATYEDWTQHAKACGVDTRLLSRREVAEMFPGMADSYPGGLHTPSDLRAEPWVAVPALAGIAAREGVTILENCAVRCLDIDAGQVAGVVTELGRIRTPKVVLAAGAWSSLFLRNHGVSVPQLSVRATVAATTPLPAVSTGGVVDDRIAFRPRADGGYSLAAGGAREIFIGPDALRALPKYLTQIKTDPFGTQLRLGAPSGFPDAWRTARRWHADSVSPFEKTRVLNPAPNAEKLTAIKRNFRRTFPDLPDFELKTTWAGMIDVMPDLVPIVDNVAPLPGLTLGTGFSGHGFGIGPAMGRVLADLVLGRPVGHDLSRFRFSRFSDGSAIRLGPGL